MRKTILIIVVLILSVSCTATKQTSKSASSFSETEKLVIDENTTLIAECSSDKTYGYTPNNPIKVGGGPSNEREFMNALAGPNGEAISYTRLGSCCPFKTRNGIFDDNGYLDIYEVTYEGLQEPIKLYLNMYDPGGIILVPYGFTFKSKLLLVKMVSENI